MTKRTIADQADIRKSPFMTLENDVFTTISL